MGTLLLDHIKKQTSSFLQEKYRVARLAFTDVTPVEMLTEQATESDDLGSPDAKTMTIIAEASFDIDDYWRIVDVLHKRLYSIDWKQWRQSYKAMVLLEFLLTHGPEEFAEEFLCDTEVIQELGTFTCIDERGFNWGASMQKKSDQILKLLGGGQTLREARLKALKITKEIQGFGSSTSSPSSSSASDASAHSSFGSFSTGTPRPNNEMNDLNKFQSPTKFDAMQLSYSKDDNVHDEGKHHWDSPVVEEKGSFLDSDDETDGEKRDGFVIGIFSKLASIGPSKGNHAKVGFTSISDVGKVNKKKMDRHSSFWY